MSTQPVSSHTPELLPGAPFVPSQTSITDSLALQCNGDFQSLTAAELDSAARQSASVFLSHSRKAAAEFRDRLLPATREVKARLAAGQAIAGCTGIEEYLNKIGLNPATVRSWEYRIRQQELT